MHCQQGLSSGSFLSFPSLLMSWISFPLFNTLMTQFSSWELHKGNYLPWKACWNPFSQSTGLRVNYKKSCLVPLNLSNDRAQILAGVFGWKLEALPFTYLGLPPVTTKPRVQHYGPIMSKIDRKLTTTSNLLTQARRLQIVNSVLSSLPTESSSLVLVNWWNLKC